MHLCEILPTPSLYRVSTNALNLARINLKLWQIINIDTSTEFADCTTGEVRLTDFTDNSEEDSRQGTIQICVNNAWGSVCSDHFFDNTDAAVFCGQLPGFKANGKVEHQLD